jgi:hypothetical protein
MKKGVSIVVLVFWHYYCCQAFNPIGLAKRPSSLVSFAASITATTSDGRNGINNNNATVSFQPVLDETGHLVKYRMVLPQRKQRQLLPSSISKDATQRLQRSITVGVACVLTHGLMARLGLSAIAASSVVGMVSCCAGLSPAMAAAGFCGSFAGMSSYVTTWADATVLGCLAGTSYFAFDQYKIGVGRGGRLGLIAFLANVAYLGQPFRLVTQTMGLLGSRTAAISLLAGTVLHFSRQMNLEEQQPQTSTAMNVSRFAKLYLLVTIGSRMLSSGSSNPLTTVLPTLFANTAVVLAASQVIQRSSGVVLPVAILGALGSMTPWAAPLYTGAFLGMTQLPSYRASLGRFVQASVFAAMLLQLGVFNGMGGKLGMLAFLGVLFGI